MKNGLLKAVVAFLFAIAISLGLFPSQAWATGDFSKSCYYSELSGSVLSSICYEADGQTENTTSIDLDLYISNVDGLLKWDSSGGFIESCEETRLASSFLTRHTEIYADCEILDYFVETSIDLDEHIANIDGVLTYK